MSNWREPKDWKLPKGDSFYQGFKNRGEIYSMTEPDYAIARKYILHFDHVIDIGAHIGTTAVRYAREFTKVSAFEPLFVNELRQNTKHLSNITVFPVALGDKEGEIEMVKTKDNSGAAAIWKEDLSKCRLKYKMGIKFGVILRTLDSYDFEKVDFIKIDTEWYLLPILKGALKTIRGSYPVIQIEANKLNNDIQECIDILTKMGYHHVDTFHVDQFYVHESSSLCKR